MYTLKNKLLICLFLILCLTIAIAEEGYTQRIGEEFSDINREGWYYTYISWAVENEILQGYPDGTVRPNQEVTEAEFLAMLFRIVPQESVQFNIERHGGDNWKKRMNTALEIIDTLESGEHWASNIYTASKVLNLDVKAEEEKNEALTREEVAIILAKFLSSQTLNAEEAVQYLLDSGLSTGKTEQTYAGYAPRETLTRAETVTFLKRLTTPVNRPNFTR